MHSKPDKFMSSLYGGLLIATLWAVPGLNFINCFCCGGVILGGFLSVILYERNITPEMDRLSLNDCIQLGITTGIISSIAAVLIQAMVEMAFGNVAIEVMMRIVEKMHVDFPSEFSDLIEEAKNAKPNLIASFLAIFIYIIPNTLFSVLGALIGWNIFKPKDLQ
jgi:hypothetical protein